MAIIHGADLVIKEAIILKIAFMTGKNATMFSSDWDQIKSTYQNFNKEKKLWMRNALIPGP
jgi:hypothetical protein